MKRVDAPEILDSDACTPQDAQAVLKVIGRINRWFGGVATTQKMVERAARTTGMKRFSLLEVAAGLGEVPGLVRDNLAQRGITLDITLLDMAHSHLPGSNADATHRNGHNSGIVGDALNLPFADGAFDLVSCSLFAHHLNPQQVSRFVSEGLRVSRRALLINDLVRHPLHLALVYVSCPIMRNRVAWLDGLTSVRRSYLPEEMRKMCRSGSSPEKEEQVEISRHYLFRMGAMVWKIPFNKPTV
jgi:ubiquinone/menaquinone biosynthesis C-methylase UbiE